MWRLLTFCLLLATAAAQSGYEYNKPGKPFTPSSQSSQPLPTAGYPSSSKVPGNQYQGPTASFPSKPSYIPSGYPDGSTPSNPLGYPNANKPLGPSGYPDSNSASAPSGYPGANKPSSEYPGDNNPSSPSGYPGVETPSGSSGYPGANTPSAPSDYPFANNPSGPSSYPGTNTPSNQSNYPKPNPSGSYPDSGLSDSPNYQGSKKPAKPSSYPGSNQQRPSTGVQDQGYQGQGNQGTGQFNGQGQNSPNYPEQSPNYPNQGASEFGPISNSDSGNNGAYEGGDYSAIPGEPDRDYPILTEIPQTSFSCNAQAYPGYYADIETRCQVFHVCANNRTFDFLCPNGTIFSQEVFVCVWWNQFDCNSAPNFFALNANLYDQSSTLTGAPITNTAENNFPGQQGSSYPNGQGTQGPSSYPGNGGQQPPNSYPDNSSQQKPTVGFQGTGINNYPETGGSPPLYSGTSDTQPSYPGSGSPNYQGSSHQVPKPHLEGPQTNYPGSGSTASSEGSKPNQPGYPNSSVQGYPSGRPDGPSFDTGSNFKPGAGFQQIPNREYLPPKI